MKTKKTTSRSPIVARTGDVAVRKDGTYTIYGKTSERIRKASKRLGMPPEHFVGMSLWLFGRDINLLHKYARKQPLRLSERYVEKNFSEVWAFSTGNRNSTRLYFDYQGNLFVWRNGPATPVTLAESITAFEEAFRTLDDGHYGDEFGRWLKLVSVTLKAAAPFTNHGAVKTAIAAEMKGELAQ